MQKESGKETTGRPGVSKEFENLNDDNISISSFENIPVRPRGATVSTDRNEPNSENFTSEQVLSFGEQNMKRMKRAQNLKLSLIVCGQPIDLATWKENEGFPQSWNGVIDRSEHNVHRIRSNMILHCHTHRELCTPIVKYVCDEIIGAKM